MQITEDTLAIKQIVWYGYSNLTAISGPFIVQRFYRNHEGHHVILRTIGLRSVEERHVSLAYDEDCGALSFYNADPALSNRSKKTDGSLF